MDPDDSLNNSSELVRIHIPLSSKTTQCSETPRSGICPQWERRRAIDPSEI